MLSGWPAARLGLCGASCKPSGLADPDADRLSCIDPRRKLQDLQPTV